MEIVYYSEDKKYAFFNGIKYARTWQGYYRATLKGNTKNHNISRLHRAIWFLANGEIPEDYDVHHKDGDKTNNSIENLALVKHGTHSRFHVSSALGKTWNYKPVQEYVCTMCGELFKSNNFYGEHQNRFCSKKCAFSHWYSQNKKQPEQVKKTCPHCKKEFISTRINQIYCKDMCGQAERTLAYRRKKREALKNNKEIR